MVRLSTGKHLGSKRWTFLIDGDLFDKLRHFVLLEVFCIRMGPFNILTVIY